MAGSYDVVVVGARCAGSPLATLLARSGLDVALVDRASFPSDTMSTHIFQTEGIAVLGRLGVVDRLRATGAPWLAHSRARIGDWSAAIEWPTRPDDPGPMLSIRRPVLDTILLETAQEAGVATRTSTRVTELVRDDGRVAGVRVAGDDGASELRARLVVGADGMGSTVGRLVGARRYNVTTNERFAYWGYYEGAGHAPEGTVYFDRFDEDFVLACPTDAGLYQVIVLPELRELDAFKADLEGSFEAYVRRSEPVTAALEGARRVGPLRGMARFEGFFRESAGPGWVLVGDAGHFKDPAPGQGISDALRQVERLAPAIVDGMAGGDLDAGLAAWWRWRDADAAEAYWFAYDLGRAGTVPPLVVEIVKGMASRRDGLRPFFDLFNHRSSPSEVLTPPRLGAATVRLLRSGAEPRSEVLRGAGRIVREEVRRRRRTRRPVYAA